MLRQVAAPELQDEATMQACPLPQSESALQETVPQDPHESQTAKPLMSMWQAE